MSSSPLLRERFSLRNLFNNPFLLISLHCSGIICPFVCFLCTLKRKYHILFLFFFADYAAAIYSCHVAMHVWFWPHSIDGAVYLKQQSTNYLPPHQYPEQISGKAGADILTSFQWIEKYFCLFVIPFVKLFLPPRFLFTFFWTDIEMNWNVNSPFCFFIIYYRTIFFFSFASSLLSLVLCVGWYLYLYNLWFCHVSSASNI